MKNFDSKVEYTPEHKEVYEPTGHKTIDLLKYAKAKIKKSNVNGYIPGALISNVKTGKENDSPIDNDFIETSFYLSVHFKPGSSVQNANKVYYKFLEVCEFGTVFGRILDQEDQLKVRYYVGVSDFGEALFQL